MKYLVQLIALTAWLSGFVFAKGFWSTLACVIPFWAWYITVETLITRYL